MIYKRCPHRGRERDRCSHPWYASYRQSPYPRAKVSLPKWTGREITTRSDALTAYDELKTEVRSGRFNPDGQNVQPVSIGPSFTVPQLVDEFERDHVQARQLKTRTEFKYRAKPILEFFADHSIDALTTRRVRDFAVWLRRPRLFRGSDVARDPSRASVNRALSQLRAIVHWGKEQGHLTSVPEFELVTEDYSRWRRVNDEEERALLGVAPPRLRALIILALDTGMRRGEMLKLKISDIELLKGVITLRGETTKDDETRHLPIATVRSRAALVWLMNGRDPWKPLITDATGDRQLSSFTRMWSTCVLKAHGLKPRLNPKTLGLRPESRQELRSINLHWHDLRHEFACRLDDRGVALGVIQRLLGHAAITTTERYLRRGLRELSAAAIKLDESLPLADLPERKREESASDCLNVSHERIGSIDWGSTVDPITPSVH